MTRKMIFEKLTEIFCEVFDDKNIVLTDATTANDVDGWDSLEHINLILSVESTFDIKFSMNEMMEMHQVGKMVDMIVQKDKQ